MVKTRKLHDHENSKFLLILHPKPLTRPIWQVEFSCPWAWVGNYNNGIFGL